jgi:hypothetical protein
VSALLAALNVAAAKHAAVTSAAARLVGERAQAYAKAETLAYSRAHPRRTVTLCSAMGSTTLHVTRGGWRADHPAFCDYQLTASGHSDHAAPAFLEELARIEDETDLSYVAGPIRLTCKAGEIVEEKFDW